MKILRKKVQPESPKAKKRKFTIQKGSALYTLVSKAFLAAVIMAIAILIVKVEIMDTKEGFIPFWDQDIIVDIAVGFLIFMVIRELIYESFMDAIMHLLAVIIVLALLMYVPYLYAFIIAAGIVVQIIAIIASIIFGWILIASGVFAAIFLAIGSWIIEIIFD